MNGQSDTKTHDANQTISDVVVRSTGHVWRALFPVTPTIHPARNEKFGSGLGGGLGEKGGGA